MEVILLEQTRSSKEHNLITFVQHLTDWVTQMIIIDVYIYIYIQWKPLNVITLGQRESDNINRLITLTEQAFRLVDCKNAK
jgi:hypothetical protein